ncbi:hypothetical protein [Stutzerimonas urumqiensis]|uniref:hypothetical protein n=1 Tax=Stutzerimonas urumqiensis TaxID=638269 RepID=UPI0013CF15D3|nr:hypothetical protein [Stutzerimonas urumqiensis]
MQSGNSRPLTKHENLLRLLFEHADEIIDKLEFLNESARKLDRVELLINGFDGAPGLIEVVESLTYEVNRVERRAGRPSNSDVQNIIIRLARVESILDKLIDYEPTRLRKQQDNSIVLRKLTAFIWLVSLLGLLNLSLLVWWNIAS